MARRQPLLLLLVCLHGFTVACGRSAAPELPPLPVAIDAAQVSFEEDVRPILDRRCAVCHGCYDAPCQLLLTLPAGLDRGASKDAVYQSARLRAAEPTRLLIDEKSTAAWRDRGFFSVLEGPGADASGSLLLRMLVLGRAHSFAPDERLPDTLPLDIGRALSCPTLDEFGAYAEKHPLGGMPYGMAPLTDAELGTLAGWAGRGETPSVAPMALPAPAVDQVAHWETFLNGDSLKERITARYLYEHWFLAHLYFESLPTGPFFRIVRSATAPGTPIDEIATRRPYDDPGSERFWYRLQPIESTIVHKTHIVYPLGPERSRRLSELFLESDWEPTRLPGYETAEASNPFVAFDPIPVASRYRFLLDDARYFVMTFIRGDVCRGQVATEVIEDRFFAAFLAPEHDLSVTDPTFLERTKELLSLPAEHGSTDLSLRSLFTRYDRQQQRFLDLQAQAYDAADPERRGPALDFLWDGDGHNPNALLTIFRHHDSASVVRGFLGPVPETLWVLDYPLFERIYYDLVAGFDVFGNVGHQVATRLYMDHLRMQSEDLFLAFLPSEGRKEMQASWYRGADLGRHHLEVNRIRSGAHGTRLPFGAGDPRAEFVEMLLARSPAAVAGPPDLLNRCPAAPCERPEASPLERRSERALQTLSGVRGPWVARLPEMAFLRVGDAGKYAIYTLLRDAAHTNVTFLFGEEKRREPEKDTLTVARGTVGSYPNFVFDVDTAEIEAFAEALTKVGSDAELESFVARFGLRRTSPRFWETVDSIHEDFFRRSPTEAGLYDLARYQNL